ncbi:MAG: ABC transporter substrate-binding protein, partial [Pseudomonas sp.]
LSHKVVMPVDFSNGGDAIVADKSITSVKDFKGKKVGFNPLSPSDFLLAYALKSNGMSDKDITPINMTPEAIPGAMASGSLPVGVTYEPNVSQILGMPGDKYHVVYSSKEAPGLITDVLAFDDKVIAKRPEAIKALMQGYLDALAFMQSNPDEAAKIIGKVLGVSPEEAKEQMSGVYNIPLAEMASNFEKSDSTKSFFGSGAVIAQLLKDNGQIPVIPDFAATFDAQFVEALAK